MPLANFTYSPLALLPISMIAPVSLQAEVFDLEALIHAVAGGHAPISVLTVDWEKLDAMVATQGDKFSVAGVRLVKVAA